jgi:hypothetical protein
LTTVTIAAWKPSMRRRRWVGGVFVSVSSALLARPGEKAAVGSLARRNGERSETTCDEG